MATTIVNKAQVLTKAQSCSVFPGNAGFTVVSPSGGTYLVADSVNKETGEMGYNCSCKWGEYHPNMTPGVDGCSHVEAVNMVKGS